MIVACEAAILDFGPGCQNANVEQIFYFYVWEINRHVTAVASKTFVFTYIPPYSHEQRKLELQTHVNTTTVLLLLPLEI